MESSALPRALRAPRWQAILIPWRMRLPNMHAGRMLAIKTPSSAYYWWR
jgi:hypothetical protein